jgi:osmotically-inducible protein OsmY
MGTNPSLPVDQEVRMRTAKAFLIGVGTAYFFDPRLGRRRRTVVLDRGLKAFRRLAQAASRKTRFAAGKAQGLYARGRTLVSPPQVATDDATVEQRIRSEAFRDVDVSPSDIELEVEDGVATLKGAVPDDRTASVLVSRVSKVAGVEDVDARLRVSSAERERGEAA